LKSLKSSSAKITDIQGLCLVLFWGFLLISRYTKLKFVLKYDNHLNNIFDNDHEQTNQTSWDREFNFEKNGMFLKKKVWLEERLTYSFE